jgi:hypothetical protein
MNVYLHYNDQQTGPYNDEQVRQMLQSGLVNTNTMAWKEGMANWIPVREMIGAGEPSTGTMPAPPASGKSMSGWSSLIFSLLSLPAWLVLLVIAGLAQKKGEPPSQEFNVIIGVIFLVGVFGNFVAMVLGAIGAFTSRARTVSILGACINAFLLLALVGLVILGLAVKHHQQQ